MLCILETYLLVVLLDSQWCNFLGIKCSFHSCRGWVSILSLYFLHVVLKNIFFNALNPKKHWSQKEHPIIKLFVWMRKWKCLFFPVKKTFLVFFSLIEIGWAITRQSINAVWPQAANPRQQSRLLNCFPSIRRGNKHLISRKFFQNNKRMNGSKQIFRTRTL